MVALARANRVVDEYLEAFRSLPDREYRSQDEVMDAPREAGYPLS
ncbi:MAG: DUF2795 domain-containing protein [Chloroflexota bacterium]|nr:DUF2795 domain-containing protein [Chloroflexota bacterium]